MRRHDALVWLIRSTVVVVAVGFAWSSFALAEEPASPPAPSTTVQEETATPAESGDVQERTVSLAQAVHFTDAKGQDMVVGPGSYRVEAEGTNRIRLLPTETGETVVIDAVSFTHEQPVERPVPVTVPDPQQPDVLHLALLSTGGTGLDAIGTYSGVKPRAVTDMRFVTSQIATQYTATQTSKFAIVPGIIAPTTGKMAPAVRNEFRKLERPVNEADFR